MISQAEKENVVKLEGELERVSRLGQLKLLGVADLLRATEYNIRHEAAEFRGDDK